MVTHGLPLLFDEIHEALRNAVFEDHAVGFQLLSIRRARLRRAAPRRQKIAVVGDDAFQPESITPAKPLPA